MLWRSDFCTVEHMAPAGSILLPWELNHHVFSGWFDIVLVGCVGSDMLLFLHFVGTAVGFFGGGGFSSWRLWRAASGVGVRVGDYWTNLAGRFLVITLHAAFLFYLVGAWAAASYLGVATGGDSIGGRWRCVCAR